MYITPKLEHIHMEEQTWKQIHHINPFSITFNTSIFFYQKLKSRNKDDTLTDADQGMDGQQVHKICVIMHLVFLCASKKSCFFQSIFQEIKTNKMRSKDIK